MSTSAAKMPQPNMLEVALAYAVRGFLVFPLAPKTKVPLIGKENGGNGCLDATTDSELIRQWWKKAPKANIGLATGHDFWVLDVDPEGLFWLGANELAATHEVATGRGGRHLFYSIPAGVVIRNSEGVIAPGVDVRGVGGYVVAAPSIHPNGKPYTWIDCDGDVPEGSISNAPNWLVDMAAKTGNQTPAFGPMRVPEIIKKGVQHRTLWRFSCSQWARGDMDEATITAAAISMSKRCELVPPEENVVKIVRDVCKRYAPGKSAQYAQKDYQGFLERFPDPTDADIPGDIRRPVLVTGKEPVPTNQLGPFLANDTGNANRLAADHGEDLLYCTDRKAFYVWNGQFWEHDEFLQVEKRAEKTILRAFGAMAKNEDSAERKAALAFFSKSLSRKALENMSHLTKKKVRAVKAADFDSDPFLLNVQNGVVNLRDGSLGPHWREHLHSKIIPIDYNPAAECPLFMGVLYRAMGSEEDADRAYGLVEYLQRSFGCAATGKPEKLLVLFFGPSGNNSKTTILETISRTLGRSYGLKLPVDSLMIDPHGASNATNSSLADLIGIRFVYTSEVNKGQQLSLAKVKDLLGLGMVKARRLRENWIEFPQQFKIFIDANDRPKISSPTDPIWNRVRCIPFDVQIPDSEIDTDLPRKLDLEAPGILAWIVEGARRYMQSGLKNYPAEVGASTTAYRDASDRLKEFIADCCYLNPNAWVSSGALLAAYQTWCNQSGETPLAANEFAEHLTAKGCSAHSREVHGKKTRGWNGINLLKTQDK